MKNSAQDLPESSGRAWARQVLQERSAEEDGHFVGTCLWPFVLPGQRVRLDRRPPRPGEILAYWSHGLLRAHRVLVVGERNLIIRADRPGAVLERVPRARAVGVWPASGHGVNVFRCAVVGRLLGPAMLALSAPVPFAILRALANRMPRPRGKLLIEVATGPAEELARDFSRVGLTPRTVSMDAWAEKFADGNGFALVARRDSRPVGALLVEAEGAERFAVSLSVLRRERGSGVAVELLEGCVHEASVRGLSLIARARRSDGNLRQGLRSVGFIMSATDMGRHAGVDDVTDAFEWRAVLPPYES